MRALAASDGVERVTGIARRPPRAEAANGERVGYVTADLVRDPLEPFLQGADAVIHLAWAIQPARERDTLRAINVEGSRRLFEAAAAAGVGAVVYASSIGAYSPAPGRERPVDESWPTGGIPTSFYSVDKAEVEGILSGFEREHPEIRVVRLRPALIFKRDAGSEIRRLFAGPLLPSRLVDPGLLPVLPWISGLRAQAVHSDDVAEAYRLAVENPDASGAFNIAADPVLEPESLGSGLGVKVIGLPSGLVRSAAAASYRLRLHPTPEGWIDMATGVPLIDSTRAREELGWTPSHRADATMEELLEGIAEREGEPTVPLESDRRRGAVGRLEELLRGSPPR